MIDTKPAKIKATCKTCNFFDPSADELSEIGSCRRHAPQPLPSSGIEIESLGQSASGEVTYTTTAYWPEVQPDDFCGEHQVFK